MTTRYKLRLLIAVVVIAIGSSFQACSKNRNISFKAAFVTTKSGVQPVARVKFYLLKKDIRTIERESGQDLYISEREILLSDINALSTEIQTGESNIKRRIDRSTKPGMQEQLAPFQANLVGVTVTDFDGVGKFENVPMGAYYLSAFTTTKGGGIVAWSLKIDTEKQNQPLILDQNNALEFEEIE